MSQNGKGSKPRPYSVKYSQYCENWENIFKKKKSEKKLFDPRINKKFRYPHL